MSYYLCILECTDHFGNVTYFKNTTLSPKCYMTSNSSVVELTCPEGYVFAENGARTVQSECVCEENATYTKINATCLCKYLVHDNQPQHKVY